MITRGAMSGATLPVQGMSLEERIGDVWRRTLPKLGPEARGQLASLMSTTSLAIMASVVTAWVASHAFGLGEVIDLLVVALGTFSVGWAIFDGLDHLYEFAVGVYAATSEPELELAANNLSRAIAVLGIQAVLAVLFRGAKSPGSPRGARFNLGPEPRAPGIRYRPTTTETPFLAAGHGETTWWGDIIVSSRGSETEQQVVLLHERVHQYLRPKFYFLRNYRAANHARSYVYSSLWRYIEESLAETVAQVGIQGFSSFFEGIRFPIANGYLYLMRAGGRSGRLRGSGLVPEAAGLIYHGIVAGLAFELRFESGVTPVQRSEAH